MRQIDLREYQRSEPLPLSEIERDALRAVVDSLSVDRGDIDGPQPMYRLTAGSTVGAVDIGNLSVLIKPKIGIPKLLSMACYATGAFKPQEIRTFAFEEERALPDTLALALVSAARRSFSRGLLHGYRRREEALQTVRGRIRFAEQLRRRYGVPLPIEVRYDEFTDDILANRLVKAAAIRLGSMRLRSPSAIRGLRWIAGVLENVSLSEYPRAAVPEVTFDRLNLHYRDVVELSRLILRHGAFEARRGVVRASAFLMDMNVVFQEFVIQALRDSFGVSDRVLRSEQSVQFDEGRKVFLRPDISWWNGRTCTFVGDAKYKNLTGHPVPVGDLYQLLAYATALDLPGGLLVYARGEADSGTFDVLNSGRRLEVAALDLSGALADLLVSVDEVARKVRALRKEAFDHLAEDSGGAAAPCGWLSAKGIS